MAGGHAIAAHGVLRRPSEDVDLFADWQRRSNFPTVVYEMIAAYRARNAAAGFVRHLFAAMVVHINRLDDEDFIPYGASPEHVATLRQRVEEWRTSLKVTQRLRTPSASSRLTVRLQARPVPRPAHRDPLPLARRAGVDAARRDRGDRAYPVGVIMAMRHRGLPIEGVQFHPESVLTQGGHLMLANWLAACGLPAGRRPSPPLDGI